MLELLVVIAIIGILVTALVVAGGSLIDNARASETRAVMEIVRSSIETFRQEQENNPTLTKVQAYRDRYGLYPPDELEVFTELGVPPAGTLERSLAPGRAEVVPGPSSSITYGPMLFQQGGLTPTELQQEHRDLAAMVLAIQLFSESGAAMLDGIGASHWHTPLDDNGNPLQFLDRDGNETFKPGEDEPIRLLIDGWGVPLSYFSQRSEEPSSNHADWNDAARGMIRLNGGQPVLVSYGPDGKEQLSAEMLQVNTRPSTMVDDWADNQKIDSPLNDDNVYPDSSLKERLRRGSQ